MESRTGLLRRPGNTAALTSIDEAWAGRVFAVILGGDKNGIRRSSSALLPPLNNFKLVLDKNVQFEIYPIASQIR